MSDICKWLHDHLESLPRLQFPFELEELPENGIYFLYEKGEVRGHGAGRPRIVRIGTARAGNFRSRIDDHYLLNERRMKFDATRPAPKDRSIFRKNIGRALLKRDRDAYLKVWEKDFTPRVNRERYGHLRDIRKERRIESEVTRLIRENFSLRFIILEDQATRMGSRGLESRLIGTIAGCRLCKPSANWLGRYSPKREIRESGLWLVQHLRSPTVNEADRQNILGAISETMEWIRTGPGRQ